jgi:MFS family permease
MGVHAGIAVGPVIGGGLVAILAPGDSPLPDRLHMAGAIVFGLNAISFLISLAVTLTVRGRFEEERAVDAQPEHEGLFAGAAYLWREPVLRRMAMAWLVFVLGMGMGMVADAPLAESFGTGGWGFGLLIACWGTGSVLGTVFGRWMNARTEPLWMVFGAAGVAVSAFGVGLFGLFPLVLVSLLVMGTSDGVSIVAENGIMQRRTPDAVRSRTMAALEAVLSLGLAIAYLAAGPILRLVEAQTVYVIAGVFAVGATLVLLPLVRLRTDASDGRPTGPGAPAKQPTIGDRATV